MGTIEKDSTNAEEVRRAEDIKRITDTPTLEGAILSFLTFVRQYHDPEASGASENLALLAGELEGLGQAFNALHINLGNPKVVSEADKKIFADFQTAANDLANAQEQRDQAELVVSGMEERERVLRELEDCCISSFERSGGSRLPQKISERLVAGDGLPVLAAPAQEDHPAQEGHPDESRRNTTFWRELFEGSDLDNEQRAKIREQLRVTVISILSKSKSLSDKCMPDGSIDYNVVAGTFHLWTVKEFFSFVNLKDSRTLPSTERVLSIVCWMETGRFISPDSLEEIAIKLREGEYPEDTILGSIFEEEGKKKRS